MDDRRLLLQAAWAYVGYGVLYEGTTAYLLFVGHPPDTLPPALVWGFMAAGLAFLVGIPMLVSRGYRSVVRLVAVLLVLRAAALASIIADVHPPGAVRAWFFFLERMAPSVVYQVALGVTLVTAWLFVRAGWK